MDTIPAGPKLAYSVSEAVAATSLSRSTLYSLMASGDLDYRQVAGRRLIPAPALLALVTGKAS